MKVFKGVDLTAMPSFVKPPTQGQVLLLDGDAAAYRAAATSAKLDTAVRKFWSIVLEELYVTSSEQVIVYLTSSSCNKLNRQYYPTAKPYQAQRNNKVKPALLEPLREEVSVTQDVPENVSVELHKNYEADDAIISGGYLYPNVVISSPDKDLRQTIHPYFETSTGQIDRLDNTFGWVDLGTTSSGSLKLIGHGYAFLCAQWLAGDPADNVVGLKLYKDKRIGVSGAVKLVKEWGDLHSCIYNTIKAYAKIKEDPLAELAMLFLVRNSEDSAFVWLQESGLDTKDKWGRWVQQLHTRHLAILKEAIAHEEDGEDSTEGMDA